MSWAPTSIALDATFGLRVLQPPSDWLDSVLKYKYYFLNFQVLVGEERLELSCDQLLFLQGISLRRYTPVFSWKGRIRTAVPVREQIYSLPVLTTHPPSSVRETSGLSGLLINGLFALQITLNPFSSF